MNNQDKDKPVVIQVHPVLVEEFKILKKEIEEKTGYKIYGGMPIISKLIGLQIKNKRLKNKNSKIFCDKVKGEKKIKILYSDFSRFDIDTDKIAKLIEKASINNNKKV